MFVEGETYYLLQCGWPCAMVFLEETATDYIFMDNMSPWGGTKEEIMRLVDKGQLTQDMTLIMEQIRFMETSK